MMRSRILVVCFLLLAGFVSPSLGQDSDVLSQMGFGRSAAITGTDVFVGEPSNERIPGRVYLFLKDLPTGVWKQSAILTSPDATPGDGFGAGLASEKDLLVVVAKGGSGQAMYTFEKSANGAWLLSQKTEPSAIGLTGGLLGPVALSNGRLYILGLLGDDTLQLTSVERVDGDWGQPDSTPLDIRNTDGLMLTAGAARELIEKPDYENGPVAVFGSSREELEPFHKLVDESLGSGLLDEDSGFGSTLAADGPIVVIGAGSSFFGYGRAFVFERDASNGDWSAVQKLEPDLVPGYPSIVGSDVACEDGTAGGFSCKHVDIQSFLNLESMGLTNGLQVNDVWGWTDQETGKEYALVGAVDRTIFIDLSDANNPVVLGWLPATPGTRANWWRDIKVYRHYAYIVADNVGNHGLQIFDLAQLRDVEHPPIQFGPSGHYAGFADAHNIFIDEDTGFAYVVGINGGGNTCGGGLHILDLSDPLDPQFVGCFAHPGTGENLQGYTHDTQCVLYHGPDTAFSGHEICVNANETAISIADVTDKSDIRALSVGRYPNSSYVHQGWFSEDHHYFFQNDETDEVNGLVDGTRTLVWDLAELEDPVLAYQYISDNKASDHNNYVSGSYLYQSNYLSGLRVLDISDPVNPVEVGFLDTAPWGDDKPGYGGSWSNYPFFKSGTIVVTSSEEGVFFLKWFDVTP